MVAPVESRQHLLSLRTMLFKRVSNGLKSQLSKLPLLPFLGKLDSLGN